ncbi:MAG: transglutaminase-like domain-containing protein [Nitrospirota bacterium]
MRKYIFCLSAGLLALLVAKSALAAPYEEWAGIYLGKEKMGYEHLKAEEVPGGFKITDEMTAGLTVLGTVQEIKTKTASLTDGSYRLKSFHFSMKSGFADSEIDGTVEGNTLRLKTGPGPSDLKKIKLNKKPFLTSGADLYLQGLKLKAGDNFALPLFDPSSLSLHNMKASVEAVEQMKEGAALVPVYRVQESYSGIDGTDWISPGRGALKSTGPMGFTFVKETREQALDMNANAPPDITALTSVPAEGIAIADSRSLSFMKARLDGADFTGMTLNGGRQGFSNGILTTKKEDMSGIKPARLPVNGPGLEKFLEPQPFVQSKDPEIIKKAGEIVGQDRDAQDAARKLLDWVYDNLRKYPSAGIPDALEVLHNLSGDCNEHATLYLALARAAGIPARMDSGLVLMDGRFYYHAWNEVYIGKWVTVDPTFGQFPADASHIRLAEGGLDSQVELLKAVGKLKVKVLEAR